MDPYVDVTARITGYGVLGLRTLHPYDWRCSTRNLWHVENVLIALPHRRLHTSDARIARLRARYHAFMAAHPGFKSLYYTGQDRWHPLPAVFDASVRLARQLRRPPGPRVPRSAIPAPNRDRRPAPAE